MAYMSLGTFLVFDRERRATIAYLSAGYKSFAHLTYTGLFLAAKCIRFFNN